MTVNPKLIKKNNIYKNVTKNKLQVRRVPVDACALLLFRRTDINSANEVKFVLVVESSKT